MEYGCGPSERHRKGEEINPRWILPPIAVRQDVPVLGTSSTPFESYVRGMTQTPRRGFVVGIAAALTAAALAETPKRAAVVTTEVLPLTTDEIVARLVDDPASLTRASLSKSLDRRAWLASDHGVVGDGVGDDGPALNALLAAAAAAGAAVQLAAHSVLSIRSRIYLPSGTRLDGQMATLRNDMSASKSDSLLWLQNVSDIQLENLNVDGNKGAYATATEWRHGIAMIGADHVTLRSVNSFRNKGDGVYVGGDVATYCRDIVLDRVSCDLNHRQGLSVIAVQGLEAINCQFTNTEGTSPQCGLVIEPNTADTPVERIRFTACEFAGNAQFGIAVAAWWARTVRQGDVDFIGCGVYDNGAGGVRLVTGDGIRFLGGSIRGNTGKGVWFSASRGITTDVQFTALEISGNTGKGILVDTVTNNLTLDGVKVYGNCTAGRSIGVDINPIAAIANVKIMGCTLGGATQTHGLRTGSLVSRVVLIGNVYPGNTVAPVSLTDDAATRIRLEVEASDVPGTTVHRSGVGSSGSGYRGLTDTVDKVLVRTDGTIAFSSGTEAAETQISRVAANVLGLGADDCLRTGRNVTSRRPNATAVGQGAQFFDTALNKPIWSNGSNWRDATGRIV